VWISSFLADLTHILERYGNRGYRAVPLEAGTIGGRMYLAAYAQRLGSTGLTFFDDDVTHFFSLHAKDKSAIFPLAIGKPLKRKSTIGFSRKIRNERWEVVGSRVPFNDWNQTLEVRHSTGESASRGLSQLIACSQIRTNSRPRGSWPQT